MIDNGSGEIDLRNATYNLFCFVFKNLKWIKIFLAVWLIGVVAFFFVERKNLKITYYVSTEYMSGQKMELILSDLKNLIKQNKYIQVANILKIPKKEAKKIASLKIIVEDPEFLTSFGGGVGLNYYFNETNTQISIELKDSINVINLVNSINLFITDSYYFNKIKGNEKIMVSLMNKNLEIQKKELDSMNKINLSKFMNTNSNIIYANDITEIKRNVYGIDEKLIKNNRGIVLLNEPINLLNYPILTKSTFLQVLLLASLQSLIIVLPMFLLYFFIIRTRRAFREYKSNM